jgi:hypothetical protein
VTLKPLLFNIRQKAVVAMDFPTSLPVPKNMMALAIADNFLEKGFSPVSFCPNRSRFP